MPRVEFNRSQTEAAYGLEIENAKQFAWELFAAGLAYWVEDGVNGWDIFPEGTVEFKERNV